MFSIKLWELKNMKIGNWQQQTVQTQRAFGPKRSLRSFPLASFFKLQRKSLLIKVNINTTSQIPKPSTIHSTLIEKTLVKLTFKSASSFSLWTGRCVKKLSNTKLSKESKNNFLCKILLTPFPFSANKQTQTNCHRPTFSKLRLNPKKTEFMWKEILWPWVQLTKKNDPKAHSSEQAYQTLFRKTKSLKLMSS